MEVAKCNFCLKSFRKGLIILSHSRRDRNVNCVLYSSFGMMTILYKYKSCLSVKSFFLKVLHMATTSSFACFKINCLLLLKLTQTPRVRTDSCL